MAQYDNARDLSDRLVEKYGRTVTYRRQTANTPADPTKPYEVAADTVETSTVFAVVVPSGVKHKDDTLIQKQRDRVHIAATELGFRPTMKDEILDGTDILRIMDFEVIAPGDQDVLYILETMK